MHLIYDSEETKSKLIELLQRRGIPFKQRGDEYGPPLNNPNLLVEIRTRLDTQILRCIAKIALNYLARIHGSEVVLLPDFNPIRSFARYGKVKSYPLVVFDATPILSDETRNRRLTNGHLITVDWSPDCNHLVAQVSLFNEVRYRVSLARNFQSVWRNLRSGHHFDVKTMTVQPLLGLDQNSTRRRFFRIL